MQSSIILTYPYVLSVPGGSGHVAMQTAIQLAEMGTRVTIISLAFAPDFGSGIRQRRLPPLSAEYDRQLRDHRIELKQLRTSTIGMFGDAIAMRAEVRRLIDTQRVDAVLGMAHEAALLAPLLRKRKVLFGMFATAPSYANEFKAPVQNLAALLREPPGSRSRARFYVSAGYRALFRNAAARCLKRKVDDFYYGKPLRDAAAVFALSEFTKLDICQTFEVPNENVHVMYCGVNDRFRQIERVSRGEITRLVHFGWFVEQKGTFTLLEALGKVAARGRRNWSIKLIGWGDIKRVNDRCREYGISDQVELVGRLEHAELAQELAAADLAILPSHAESFGLAIAEAQTAGLPVIACRIGAVPEVVKDGETSWLVPGANSSMLAAAIEDALDHPAETFAKGLAGPMRVTQMFSWRTAAELVQTVFDNASAARPATFPLLRISPGTENN